VPLERLWAGRLRRPPVRRAAMAGHRSGLPAATIGVTPSALDH